MGKWVGNYFSQDLSTEDFISSGVTAEQRAPILVHLSRRKEKLQDWVIRLL